MKRYLSLGGRTESQSYPRRDQFGAELLYFSSCIQRDVTPAPSGEEGLADLIVLEALSQSATTGRPVSVAAEPPRQRPDKTLHIDLPPIREPNLVHAAAPDARRQFGRSPESLTTH
jgi:glucose-fructose oxidoreductase